MENTDPRIDAYILKSADFAKPVLNHLRHLIHESCPLIQETIKWGFPHFEYKGTICSMAGFKQHCVLSFWKASLMTDPYNLFQKIDKTAMGQLGQIKNVNELPSDDILKSYFREAYELNEKNIKLPLKPKQTKELEIPSYFTKALSENQKALETFQNFSYSHKKEYVDWVTEAKTEETRTKRLATSMEWLEQGKPRMWKYLKK
ncbi:MAG TPA: YdeI/OmpD-associated family protein [Sphingobacteriaceae bacterium]